jgi:hypothetical protein
VAFRFKLLDVLSVHALTALSVVAGVTCTVWVVLRKRLRLDRAAPGGSLTTAATRPVPIMERALCVPIARASDGLAVQETVCRSGNTSLSRPVLTSKTKPRTGTSGEIHGCDRAFSICSLVLATASVKL